MMTSFQQQRLLLNAAGKTLPVSEAASPSSDAQPPRGLLPPNVPPLAVPPVMLPPGMSPLMVPSIPPPPMSPMPPMVVQSSSGPPLQLEPVTDTEMNQDYQNLEPDSELETECMENEPPAPGTEDPDVQVDPAHVPERSAW